MTWRDPPHAGEEWTGRSESGGRETRRVVDRTLGGDVLYRVGADRYRYEYRCTEAEWLAWAATARRRA